MSAARIMPGDGDSRHGTENGYGNLKCRCDRCRAAHAIFVKKCRVQRNEKLPAVGEMHGTQGCYINYDCRCIPCTISVHLARSGARRNLARSIENHAVTIGLVESGKLSPLSLRHAELNRNPDLAKDTDWVINKLVPSEVEALARIELRWLEARALLGDDLTEPPRRRTGSNVPIKDRLHGTDATYQAGCDCTLCRQAHRTSGANWFNKPRPPLAPDDPRHGTVHAYYAYKCRCDRCRAARRDAGKRNRDRAARDALQTAKLLATGVLREPPRTWLAKG